MLSSRGKFKVVRWDEAENKPRQNKTRKKNKTAAWPKEVCSIKTSQKYRWTKRFLGQIFLLTFVQEISTLYKSLNPSPDMLWPFCHDCLLSLVSYLLGRSSGYILLAISDCSQMCACSCSRKKTWLQVLLKLRKWNLLVVIISSREL